MLLQGFLLLADGPLEWKGAWESSKRYRQHIPDFGTCVSIVRVT